jgi:ribosome-binding protein aMBF1 (putative translation factor)
MNKETFRFCPECNKELIYKYPYQVKNSLNKLCKSCMQKGKRSPNFGRHLSQDEKNYLSKWHKGKSLSKETKEKISLSRKGIIFSEEHKKNISEANKGKIGEKSYAWKGDNVGYVGLHNWISKNKPKTKECEICGKEKDKNGKTKLELANISGEYKRDINDFEWAHRSCHQNKDFPDGKIGKYINKSKTISKINLKYNKGRKKIIFN